MEGVAEPFCFDQLPGERQLKPEMRDQITYPISRLIRRAIYLPIKVYFRSFAVFVNIRLLLYAVRYDTIPLDPRFTII